jgi:hypothetical protein
MPTMRKYLITWKLLLGQGELERLSRRPADLDRGLGYVKSLGKGSHLELYRVVAPEELSRFSRPLPGTPHAQPNGIAIIEGASLEEVRAMVDRWVKGLTYGSGTVPVQNYVEFEIKPLVDLLEGEVG